MIVALHGIPGLSYAEVTYMLSRIGVGFLAVTNKPQKVGTIDTEHVIPVVFASARAFYTHHAKVNFRAVALICDTYPKLHAEMSWPVVGVEKLPGSNFKHRFTTFTDDDLREVLRIADSNTEATPINLKFTVYDPTDTMIQKFGKSALSQSQTIMYKIKNLDQRSKTFAVIRDWFHGTIRSEEVMRGRVNIIHSNEKFANDLHNVLLSEHAKILRKAVIESKTNVNRIDAICKRAKISPFDVRYLLSKSAR